MGYDLGAGTGKPSVVFALTLPLYFSKCVGIELFDGLYQRSLALKEVYEAQTKDEAVPAIEFV